jgi:transcription initiation factor TFIIF subunit alpha
LYTTKKALREGLLHHIARFASKKAIDPANENEFVRPVRLHRRDPRAPPAGARGIKDEDVEMGDVDSKDGMLDDKERERQEILRAEREAQRQADLAQIAPTGSGATGSTAKKAATSKQKKTQQVSRGETAEGHAASQLRYEEALPWHLEDFDNRNTWVGSYEAALSNTYVMLVSANERFDMVPLQKWYKFTPKNQFKALTIEEAEAKMKQKYKDPRWFMETQKAAEQQRAEAQNRRAGKKLFVGKWESNTANAPGKKSEVADADELDFEDDMFADDEDNHTVEPEQDDDTKLAAERIKRDQLQANIFDLKDEREYEKEDEEERKEEELKKHLGRGVRKALMKREKNFIYDSESDNPYSEASACT